MDNELSVGKRVSLIRDKYCVGSNVKFAEIMCESTTTVSNWCNSESLGKQVFIKILSKFEVIDANWLLMGTGEMTKKSEEETSDNLNNNEMEETYKVALKVMAKELKELEKENAELRGRLELNERAIG